MSERRRERGGGKCARRAVRTCSSLFAPVTTILPDLKISAVVFGSRIRMMTAEKRCGAGAGRSERERGERCDRSPPRLWVVLSIPRVHGNRLEVQRDGQIARRYYVPVHASSRG